MPPTCVSQTLRSLPTLPASIWLSGEYRQPAPDPAHLGQSAPATSPEGLAKPGELGGGRAAAAEPPVVPRIAKLAATNSTPTATPPHAMPQRLLFRLSVGITSNVQIRMMRG